MSDRQVDEAEVRDAVRSYILEQFLPGEDPSSLADSTPLVSGGVLDSISTARLVTYLENRYEVRFKPAEVGVNHLDSVDRIVEAVMHKVSR